jgi:hypothetical protein
MPSPCATSSRSEARIVDNAFFVLGLTPRASWPEVAQAAETLLAALEARDPTAATYDTPLGPRARTAGAIRVARARLRDPDERIQQEIWWEAPVRRPSLAADSSSDAFGVRRPSLAADSSSDAFGVRRPSLAAVDGVDAWPHAPAAWGWRSR